MFAIKRFCSKLGDDRNMTIKHHKIKREIRVQRQQRR